MKPQRHLSLRRERLAELSPHDLRDAVGGDSWHTRLDPQCHPAVTSVYACQTYEVTCWGCPASLPIDQCPIQTA